MDVLFVAAMALLILGSLAQFTRWDVTGLAVNAIACCMLTAHAVLEGRSIWWVLGGIAVAIFYAVSFLYETAARPGKAVSK